MSDIIQLLPDSVANQIAAGEVIQRPASVVKELVENSVDAGARNIHVQIVDAGRTLVQVIDDGKGMSETDARLAFERHATSKIRKADDLFSLQTMGFRGEALPSIAAVAQVELTTRMEDEEIGTHLSLQGSRIVQQEPASCPVGSNFKVENLFFNVPARRKFLKTNATELSNILMAFERIVLVYPEIAFTLHSNGQELMNLKTGSLRQRICDVFGKKLNQDLLPVEVDTVICRIRGFVGKPESAKKKGVQNYFFVNGRFMKHAYFHKAVTNAFERLLPEGMQVPYFIYFEVAPADIDVNIHPTKTEIKFENEQSIWQILSAAVKEAIGRFCDVPTIDFDSEGRPDIPVFDPLRDSVATPKVTYNPDYNPFKNKEPHSSSGDSWQQLYEGALHSSRSQVEQTELFVPDETATDSSLDLIAEKSPTHYQYKGRYILTAVKSGLMIIDQHRADVRIRYERYVDQLSRHTARIQRLLFSEVMQFSPAEAVVVQKVLPELQRIGFDLTDLGGGSFAVGGVPAELDGLNPVTLLHSMIADAAAGVSDPQLLHSNLALSLARNAAIPVGQVLDNEEMERLVNELFACSNVNYTPDGRTVLCILPQSDIDKLLG
ncbi:MAG: DNA mismatch repair endonuclease MutL [Prevotella sp.]|nr:DNA mismatch repair endonuclease MutL [Prevotella sp.]